MNNFNGGAGWTGPWQTQNGSTTPPGYDLIASSPLVVGGTAFGGYATGGSNWQSTGRSFDTSSAGPFAAYLNASSLIGKAGTSLYFSVLMRKDANTDDEMSVTLHSNANPPWNISPGIAVGHFGSGSNTGSKRYWSLKIGSTVYKTSALITVGQAAQLVCRIEFAATSTISVFVNPPASGLPSVPSAKATTTNAVAFRSLGYYGGSGSRQSSIDDIQLASSFSAVGAGSLTPPATPTGLSAVPGSSQVRLSWTAVPNATMYQIYYAPNGGAQLSVSTSSTSIAVTGLTNGISCVFYLVAIGAGGTSAPSATVTAVPIGPALIPHPSLGTNLSEVTDYSRELPFVDVFKMARPWIPQVQGGAWGKGLALALDSNGWITSLQPGQYAETILLDNALDDRPNFPAGQYVILYDGEGTLQFDMQSATIVSQTPGRIVINIGVQNGVFLMETATNPANYLRNIRFLMPGSESTYFTQPFNPVFLQKLNGYKTLRFMEWMLTNGSTQKNWADRPVQGDYTYMRRGVPVEVLVALANATGITPWFNVPAQATDDYVLQLATLINQQLSASMKFYLEYSNETWNGSFSQRGWLQAQGQAAGYSSDPTLAGFYYNAARSSQIFAIATSALSSPARMIRVMAAQAANSWLSDQMLGFQNSFANADVLAIAPYFNCDDTGSGGFGVLGDPLTAAQVDTMSSSQIIDIELAHINGCANEQMMSSASVAKKYGLKLVAYEGGQSLVGYYGAENDVTMTSLFKAANRDSRMAALYTQYLSNWVAAGGDMFVHFSDVTAFTRYGSWGALEYQDQDPGTAPKFQALTAFAAQHP
jgi:hypothetical protein